MGILKIGVELEGAWSGEQGVPPFQDLSIKRDGSLNTGALMGDEGNFHHVGELNSPALQEANLWPWLKTHWPTRVDRSCGFHVHVSVDDISYSILADPRFVKNVADALTEWAESYTSDPNNAGPFVELLARLSGSNQYCLRIFAPNYQVRGNESRYALINFCKGKHGTIELRVLPMFPEYWMGRDGIKIFLREIRKFLKERKFCPCYFTLNDLEAPELDEKLVVEI